MLGVRRELLIPYNYYYYSSKPPAENEYVIPLIHRTIWRHPGKEQGREGAPGGAPGGEEKVKTEDELTLDREAAEAIVNGKYIINKIGVTLHISPPTNF